MTRSGASHGAAITDYAMRAWLPSVPAKLLQNTLAEF